MPHLPPPPALDTEQDLAQMCEVFGITHEDLLHEINYRLRAKFERALRVQQRAAKVQGERRILRAGGEGGEVTQQLHPVLYQALVARYGYAAMQDDSFIRDLHKAHPETKVKTVNDRLTIVRPDFAGNLAPNTRAALAPVRPGVRGKRGRWAA